VTKAKAKAELDNILRVDQQPAASYRTKADRYRHLLAETTTPALSEYFRE
jgi:hypothetical protein